MSGIYSLHFNRVFSSRCGNRNMSQFYCICICTISVSACQLYYPSESRCWCNRVHHCLFIDFFSAAAASSCGIHIITCAHRRRGDIFTIYTQLLLFTIWSHTHNTERENDRAKNWYSFIQICNRKKTRLNSLSLIHVRVSPFLFLCRI